MSTILARYLAIFGFLFFTLTLSPAYAETDVPSDGTTASTTPSADTAAEAAFRAAHAAMQKGPTTVALGGQATLKLPEGFGYIPRAEAQRLLTVMGNGSVGGLEGMIYPLSQFGSSWFMVVTYDAAGYVKDDDAKNWNAEELLDSIREGTAAQNEERTKMGIPEMEIIGWVQKPQYNSANHQLVWSISSRDKGANPADVNGINYNTLALGREGYFSVNLVTDTAAVEALKPVTQTLLAALVFNDGKRYADFNSSTDKVAEYGLAALVAGVAAKKLGLLALMAAFFAKFAKIIIVAVIAGGAAIRKLFQRGQTS